MSLSTKLLLLTLFITSSVCLQLPFNLPFFKQKEALTTDQLEPSVTTPRIAIIGAGAGGSSAAFWISKAKQRFGIDVEIDVYERASYIGGRECLYFCSLVATCHDIQEAPLYTLIMTLRSPQWNWGRQYLSMQTRT